MDLQSVLSDTALLSRLSREFELLKRAGGDVDFDLWIQQRLREAASAKLLHTQQAATAVQHLPSHEQQQQEQQQPGRQDSFAGAHPHAPPPHSGPQAPASAAVAAAVAAASLQHGAAEHARQGGPHAEAYPAHQAPAPGAAVGQAAQGLLHAPMAAAAAVAAAARALQQRSANLPPPPPQLPALPQDQLAFSAKFARPPHYQQQSYPSVAAAGVYAPHQLSAPGPWGPPAAGPYQVFGAPAAPELGLSLAGEGGEVHSHVTTSWAPLQQAGARVQGIGAAAPDTGQAGAAAFASLPSGAAFAPPFLPGPHTRPSQQGATTQHLLAAGERERRLALSAALARQRLASEAAVGTAKEESRSSELQHVLQLLQTMASQNENLSREVQQAWEQLQEQGKKLEGSWGPPAAGKSNRSARAPLGSYQGVGESVEQPGRGQAVQRSAGGSAGGGSGGGEGGGYEEGDENRDPNNGGASGPDGRQGWGKVTRGRADSSWRPGASVPWFVKAAQGPAPAAPAAGRLAKAGGRRNRKGGAGSPGRGSPRRGDGYPGGGALGSDQQRSSEAKRRERKEQLKGLLRQLLGVGGATAATSATAGQARAAPDGRAGVTQLMRAFHALATGGASVGDGGKGREEEAGAAGAMQRQRSGSSGRLSRQRSGAAGGPAQAGVAATGVQQLQRQQQQQDGTDGGEPDGEVPRRSVRAMEEEVMEIMQADIERAKEEHRVRKLDELEERMSLALSRIEQQQVAMARWQPPTLHATSSGIAQSNQPLGPVTWAGAGAGTGVGAGSAGNMLLGAGSAWNVARGAGLGAAGLMTSAGLGGGDGGSSAVAAGLFGALAAQGLTLGARPLVQVQQQGTQAAAGMHASQGTQAGGGMYGGLGGAASTASIGVGGEASGLLSRAVSEVGQGFGSGMGAGLAGRMLGGMAAGGGGGSAASELGLAELQQLLLVLQRMEDKEEAMRCRWFDSQGTHRNPSAAPPLVVRDGVLGSVPSSGSGTLTHPGAGSAATGKAAGTTQTAAATTATTATAATAATPSSSHAAGPAGQALTTRPAGQGFGSTSAVQPGFKGLAPQGSSSVSAAAVLGRAPEPLIPPIIDPISEDQLERVQEAREMFIRYQAMQDGELVSSGLSLVGNTEVVEDVADALIEEILYEHALELAGLCDNVAEHLFDQEFGDPTDE